MAVLRPHLLLPSSSISCGWLHFSPWLIGHSRLGWSISLCIPAHYASLQTCDPVRTDWSLCRHCRQSCVIRPKHVLPPIKTSLNLPGQLATLFLLPPQRFIKTSAALTVLLCSYLCPCLTFNQDLSLWHGTLLTFVISVPNAAPGTKKRWCCWISELNVLISWTQTAHYRPEMRFAIPAVSNQGALMPLCRRLIYRVNKGPF